MPAIPYNGKVVGWVGEPNVRGTFDIAWSCLFTVFLCIWCVLCLNVPASDDSAWRIIRRKFRWSLLAIFGPEFLLCFAIGQWASAKRSVKAFQALGHDDWTLTHAFFADMGGFVLQTENLGRFPVNAKHLCYLVQHNIVPYPAHATSRAINDRSKADGWAKLIICLQTSWFLIQCLGRAITRAPTSTLELGTVAFVLCTLATYFFWYFKPQDVQVPFELQAGVITDADLPGNVFSDAAHLHPLDSIDDIRPTWSCTVMPHLGFPHLGPQARPLDRLPNDRLPAICVKSQVCLCIITMVYASVHMVGWNFSFASITEQWMWRAASIVHLATTASFWIGDTPHRYWQKRFLRPSATVNLTSEGGLLGVGRTGDVPHRDQPEALFSHSQMAASTSRVSSSGTEKAGDAVVVVTAALKLCGSIVPPEEPVRTAVIPLAIRHTSTASMEGDESPAISPYVHRVHSISVMPLAPNCQLSLPRYSSCPSIASSSLLSTTLTAASSPCSHTGLLPPSPSCPPSPCKDLPGATSSHDSVTVHSPCSANYDVPRWQVILTTSLTALYAVARMYLVVEVFIGLRAMDAGVYMNVNWSAAMPYF